MDGEAHFRDVVLRLLNTERSVSTALHLETGVGFQGAVRPGGVLLVGDETAVAKNAGILISRDAGRGRLCGMGDLIRYPIGDLAHSVVTSSAIEIPAISHDLRPGIRFVLQTQGRRPFLLTHAATRQ